MEKGKTFKDKMDRLNEIVDKVENSVLSLEESLKLYEEGMNLIKDLTSTLDEAEKKVEKLTIKSN